MTVIASEAKQSLTRLPRRYAPRNDVNVMNDYLQINPKQEKQKIITFLKDTFVKQHIDHAVIGLSGGIDSTVSFFLLKEVLPVKHIHVAHLYYFQPNFADTEKVVRQAGIPPENIQLLSIKKSVDSVLKLINGNVTAVRDSGQARMTSISKEIELNNIRLGNIAARMRMIVLFDLAKKVNGLVCGTENKTENLLGYFTRYGDQASDIEPIEHLYKTQVLQLAKHLGVPASLINQQPTAGLWQGQTDEGEFGFTYEEADQVLYFHLEQNKSLEELEGMGLQNAKKVLERREKNLFKHQVPYHL